MCVINFLESITVIIEIIDRSGRVVFKDDFYNLDLKDAEINIEHLNSGFYSILIYTGSKCIAKHLSLIK